MIGIANAFSGGIFLSISLLHLLPESSESFHDYFTKINETPNEHVSHFPFSYLLAFVGYVIILLIEKIVFDSSNFIEGKSNKSNKNNHLNHNHQGYNINSRRQTDELINEYEKSPAEYSIKNPISVESNQSKANYNFIKSKSNINSNVNLHNNFKLKVKRDDLEGIEEENKEHSNNIKKFRSDSFIPKLENELLEDIKIYKKTPLRRNTLKCYNSCMMDDFVDSKQVDTFVDNLLKNEEERKEKKFKKLFSQNGKFASLAKQKFNSLKFNREVNDKYSPDFDIARKVYNEVFEETRPSLNEKELLLRKEETKLFNKKNITSFLLLFALSVHAFFEGIALGLLVSDREILYMLMAISFHKWVEAISIGINLQKSQIEKEVLLVLIVLFSLTTPIGIIFGIVLKGISQVFEAIFLSISAGTFLYISASEIVVEEFAVSHYKKHKFFAFVFGALIITIFTIFEYSN